MTSGTEKTLAKKLKNNMGKLLLSTLLMSIAVVSVTILVTVEGRAKTSDSSSITATTNPSEQLQLNETTQKPATNVSWSHENLKTGNGSVVIDKGIETFYGSVFNFYFTR